jgi:ribonucleotide monophosphatase NagD (HAD superfamily)
MVKIGDQLETDIRGAEAFGLDSVLVGTGISDPANAAIAGQPRPTYRMGSIGLGRSKSC